MKVDAVDAVFMLLMVNYFLTLRNFGQKMSLNVLDLAIILFPLIFFTIFQERNMRQLILMEF